MAAVFRFLFSLLAHSAWQRSGRRGPLPPVRLPGKRGGPLPVLTPWQIMAASWAAERAWKAYGPTVKQRLSEHSSPVAHKINDLLPGPQQMVPAAAPNPTPVPAVSAGAPSGPPAPVPTIGTPSKGAMTQVLPQDGTDTLPSGSVLRSMRPSN